MVQLRSYDSDDIRRLAPMEDAIAALRAAFATGPNHIARLVVPASTGEVLIMPAVAEGAAGVKLLMVQPANAARDEPVIQGIYLIFDAEAGRLVALIDGAALTSIRTPAVSAIATDALARHDARTLGIIGSGPQARGHAEAIPHVRPDIARIVIAGRNREHAENVVADLDLDCEVVVGSMLEAARCDVVCTATRSTTPVLTTAMVRPGTHINAVGAYRDDMCEIDADLVGASTVFVDDDHACRTEAGDLIAAAIESSWTWQRVAGDLSDLSAGRAVRTSPDQITLFKSVGLAFEDLVIARLVAGRDGVL